MFINGCHTTAVEPERAYNLVAAFTNLAGAAGVVGTEITVFEPMAQAFAEECFEQFLGGQAIGEAIRRARLKLLKEKNPLGLVYMPFVLASLGLDPALVRAGLPAGAGATPAAGGPAGPGP